MWLCFYICWYYYDNSDKYRVNTNYMRVWPLIVSLLAAVGIAVFFELASLFLAAAQEDQATGETFEKAEYAATTNVATDGGENVGVGCTTSLEYRIGRPKAEDFSVGFTDSERPAIFCCGPVPLVENVKAEARRRNGLFGFTGVAFYEEPFEM